MAENRRILIVDHEPKAVLEMGRILRPAGYEVLEAFTGKECLGLIRDRRPHLILIDEALSDVSGIDLVKQIKRDAELSRAYVAIVSRGGTAPAIQARALENGADAVLERTPQTRELLAHIEALLRRQVSEESLRTSLQDHRATFDAMSDAVYLVNNEYKITDCNLAMARFLARPRGEIVGARCFELVHGTSKPLPACLGHRVRETRRREMLVVPMGERWLQVDVDPLLDASNAVIGSVHVLRDITQQRHNEDALQHAQSELDMRAAEHHLALDKASKDVQAEIDARVRAQDVLKGVQADLELRSRELELTQAGRSAEQTLRRAEGQPDAAAAETADLIYTWSAKTGQARLVSNEQGRILAQGSLGETSGEGQPMAHAAERARVEETLAHYVHEGAPWSAEYSVVDPDGHVAHWALSAAPVGDSPAQEWLAVVRDVTAERQAKQEQETLAAWVSQTQKMDALRRVAAGMANEFNRLLALIVGQVEMLLARIEPSNPLYADLQAIAKVARQGVALIRQLLAFAGREAVQPEVLDVNAAIEKLKPKLRRTLGKGVELQLALTPQLKPVYADARVLQEIWLSLAARAAAAMPLGGVLRIDTATVTLSAADVRIRPLSYVGDYVRVTLAHTGPALSQVAPEGVFELQLVSPEAATGAELGLGVIYGLVQQLGGFMEVAQTAAGETEWAVYVPAYLEQGAAEQGVAAAPEQASAVATEAAAVTAPSAAAEPAPAEAGAPPAAGAGTPDMPQAVATAGEQTGAPATEKPAAEENVARAPAAGDSVASEPIAEVPAWLVEEPPSGDITPSASTPADTSGKTSGDITEAEPPPSPPSGLSGLRSRLRRRRSKG